MSRIGVLPGRRALGLGYESAVDDTTVPDADLSISASARNQLCSSYTPFWIGGIPLVLHWKLLYKAKLTTLRSEDRARFLLARGRTEDLVHHRIGVKRDKSALKAKFVPRESQKALGPRVLLSKNPR